MDARTLFRSGGLAVALAAAASAGCVGAGGGTGGSGFRFPGTPRPDTVGKSNDSVNKSGDVLGKSSPRAPDNPAPPDPAVIPAGGTVQPNGLPTIPPVPPTPVPSPRATAPPAPTLPTAAPPGGGPAAPAPAGASGSPQAPVAPAVPGPWLGGAVGFGTNQRVAPGAVGSLLRLGPNESPLDRVVELARQVEATRGENAALLGRIRELEGLGLGREQALSEALREVDNATAEVGRARTDLVNLRRELQALKDRLEEIEKEDVETLKLVIAALDRLLTTPGRLP